MYKLTDVQKEIQTVVEKYSQFAVVNLYVAGYTDTVGDAGHNIQLSTDRAKSIGTWFKRNGFKGNIYYQGFGERVLAVPTADGVDEAANRRVLYVVAATPPKSQSSFPNAAWKALR
jgi:outer membrane protein OmpA-like peptidoglycan-associated protein